MQGLALVLDLEVAHSTWPTSPKPGGPGIDRRMSRENRLWGTERIRGEPLKLAIVVSNRSIRRYRWRGPRRERSQGWRTFLRNQIKGIWAADYSWSRRSASRLWVFLCIS